MIFKELCVNSSIFSVFVNFSLPKATTAVRIILTSLELCLKPVSLIIHCNVTANHLYFHYHHGSVQLQLAEEDPLRLNEVLRQHLLIQIYASLTLHLSSIRFR